MQFCGMLPQHILRPSCDHTLQRTWNIFQVFHCVHFECPAQSEETSVIVTSVRDDAGVTSHPKNILSSSTGINRTAQVSENDEASDGEAAVNHNHQYQATFQEDNKAASPQPWSLTTVEAATTLSLIAVPLSSREEPRTFRCPCSLRFHQQLIQ
jgi:hypothetical protein